MLLITPKQKEYAFKLVGDQYAEDLAVITPGKPYEVKDRSTNYWMIEVEGRELWVNKEDYKSMFSNN